jgi:hypothetical protein
MLQTLSGPFRSKVDTLTFTLRDPDSSNPGSVPSLSGFRLFSTGGGSELLEWDLSSGCVRVSTSRMHAPKTKHAHRVCQEDDKLQRGGHLVCLSEPKIYDSFARMRRRFDSARVYRARWPFPSPQARKSKVPHSVHRLGPPSSSKQSPCCRNCPRI